MYRGHLSDPSVVKTCGRGPAEGAEYSCTYIELGDPGLPHAVFEYGRADAERDDELRPRARALRRHRAFPKGANVTFCCMKGENSVFAKTFERGVEDFTLACGTGARVPRPH
jgi:diaminopimelate epimerase